MSNKYSQKQNNKLFHLIWTSNRTLPPVICFIAVQSQTSICDTNCWLQQIWVVQWILCRIDVSPATSHICPINCVHAISLNFWNWRAPTLCREWTHYSNHRMITDESAADLLYYFWFHVIEKKKKLKIYTYTNSVIQLLHSKYNIYDVEILLLKR